MKYILSLSLMALLCTCGGKEVKTSTVTAFGETGRLTASVKKIPEPVLLPRFVCAADDYLFVYKEKEAKMFAIFGLPDGEYLCSAGQRGQGPDDFMMLDTRSFQVVGNGFRVMESGTNRLKTVEFKDGRLSVTKAEQIDLASPANNGFYPLADSVYLTFGQPVELNEYGLYDKKTGNLVKTGDYPQWATTAATDPAQLMFMYIKTCVVHPDGSKFATFYSRFKRLRIYDREANLLHDVEVRIAPFSTSPDAEPGKQPVYYIGQPQTAGDYIYALCANGPDEPADCELHVWDWDGNPVACYDFDRKVTYIALSQKHGKLYAFDLATAEDEFYIYDLPQLR
ncbi:MAG: TolB-like 6-bladed beta-propeller domain-containing protein [Tannerella sp.]|jgi:hypothetical protein|nr:TolB-like 6-bladed beta-propeller domain-containing protein [Tannerella sp.]